MLNLACWHRRQHKISVLVKALLHKLLYERRQIIKLSVQQEEAHHLPTNQKRAQSDDFLYPAAVAPPSTLPRPVAAVAAAEAFLTPTTIQNLLLPRPSIYFALPSLSKGVRQKSLMT